MNIMFQTRFAPLIVSGQKIHTIRPKRKKPLRFGMPLSLRVWTGKPYRSPQREFAKATVERVAEIEIGALDYMRVGGTQLGNVAQLGLAWHDGFENQEALRTWFFANHGLPFVGEIIYWKPNGPTTLPT